MPLPHFHPKPLWSPELYTSSRPIIIAGPCSAESREQVLATARGLASEGVQIFRAGVWKPRTYPGSFEGWGEKALPWLQEVRAETGMLVGCEVGLPQHVEAVLRAELDYIWIGARTCSNPFSMAELAEALRGTSLPVLVKNPLTPSPDIWKGALLRLVQAGLTKLALIHRGFDSFATPEYRFSPLWPNILALHEELPQVPLYFDPSHIAGDAALIEPLLRTARALPYEGWIIESHIAPHEAQTDAKQQITPAQLGQVLQTKPASEEALQMELLRTHLDWIDEQSLILLSERRTLAKSIGNLKKTQALQALQTKRRDDKLQRLLKVARKYHLPESLIQSLYREVHEESVLLQEEIIQAEESKDKP